MKARFFLLMAVGDESSQQINYKIDRTTMMSMLDLRDILESVNDAFNDRSFAHQQFI